MASPGDNRRGDVKWYVPSVAALVLGLVAVIVVWIVLPPASTVNVPTYDEDEGRKKITVHLPADATNYVIGGTEKMKLASKLDGNGNVTYDPVDVIGPVTSIFKEVEYEGEFRGILQPVANAGGGVDQTVTGTIEGETVIVWNASTKAAVGKAVATKCKIVDEHPKGRLLVKGTVTVRTRPILLGPGAVIENARTDKRPATFLDASGLQKAIPLGKSAAIDPNGLWVLETDYTTTP